LWNLLLSIDDSRDRLNRRASVDGELTSKIAYNTLHIYGPKVRWCKLVWNNFVPPSRYFIFWRLAHKKMPTDDCHQHEETSTHIFFSCPETQKLWQRFCTGIDQGSDCSGWLNVIDSCVGNWSKQVQQVLIAAVLHSIWRTWIERNDGYFNNNTHSMEHLFRSVIVEVGCRFNIIQASKSAMLDAKLSHLFDLYLRWHL
jgi:hypothetical protein